MRLVGDSATSASDFYPFRVRSAEELAEPVIELKPEPKREPDWDTMYGTLMEDLLDEP